ncbi:MAG: hypothetical protein D4S01_07405 [Dehalococcoidia bacterium]|nr:MAG: hypothetical protein D4S01_07405 [Dehalococcoidia bacterium]
MTKTRIVVPFLRWACLLVAGRYSNNGRRSIELIDDGDGEPIATATINLVNEYCGPDEVYIKDYSENEGMLDTLVTAGVIEEPMERVQSGFIKAPRCKLTAKGLSLWEEVDE